MTKQLLRLGTLCLMLVLAMAGRAENVTATWDFHNADGNYYEKESANIQGKVGTLDAEASDGSTITLTVDATNGKLQSRGNGDAQFNANTIIKVPVKNAGDVVTVVSYPGYHNYTVGGVAAEADETTYEATAADASQGYVEIVGTGSSYLYSISVVQKANSEGGSEEPAVNPYENVSASWNFAGGSANAAATAMAYKNESGTIESEEGNGVLLTVEPNGLNIRNNGNSIQTGNGVVFKVPVKTTKDVVTVVGYPGYFAYSIGGVDATEATTTYTAKGSDVSQGYVEIVSKGQYLISISVTQKSVYSEKPLYETDFSDWKENAAKASTTPFTVEKETRYSHETISFELMNTDVMSTDDTKFSAYTTLPHWTLRAAKAADPYIMTSPLAQITKVRFIHGATGSNRGWKLEAKGDGDEDWVVVSDSYATPNAWCEVEKEINKTNVQLRWTNLNEAQNAYMFELDIYGMVDMSKSPVLGTFKANGKEYVAGDIFEMNAEGNYETTIELSKSENMISDENTITDAIADNGDVGTISYNNTNAGCTVTIPVTANGETVNYVITFVLKPDFALTYIDTDGSVMGSQVVEKDGTIGEFAVDFNGAIASEGEKVRGWFQKADGGKKYTTDEVITSDLKLYAVATEIEEATTTARYSYNLTDQYFYAEDHECFIPEGKGKWHDAQHGWDFTAGDMIHVPVAGDANLMFGLCQYSGGKSILVTDAEGNTVAVIENDKASSDGAQQSISYTGAATTLTITFNGTSYLHSLTVANVSGAPVVSEGQWYTVEAGNATSLLNTIDAVNASNSSVDAERAYVYLPNGTYDLGKAVLTNISGHNISFIGESMEGVIIKNAPDKENEGIGKTATLYNTGNNNYFQDLTLQNELDYYGAVSAGQEGGRAVCLWDKGTKTICKNVTMLSYQDTYYSNNNSMQAYWETSDIHGTVDFICGGGDIMFKETTLTLEKRQQDGKGGRTITAPTTSTDFGYVFESCKVVDLAEGMGDWNFGRTWQNNPICVWLNTTLDEIAAKSIISSRWTQKGMNSRDPKLFGEHGTMDVNGNDITPASNKIVSYGGEFETILSVEQTVQFEYSKMFTDWDPASLTLQKEGPANLKQNGNTLSWDAMDGVEMYLIERDGEHVALTAETTYTIEEATGAKANRSADAAVYTVRAANTMGGFGEKAEATVETGINSLNTREKATRTEYFTTSGMKTNGNVSGVTIKVETLQDGKKVTTKVIK